MISRNSKLLIMNNCKTREATLTLNSRFVCFPCQYILEVPLYGVFGIWFSHCFMNLKAKQRKHRTLDAFKWDRYYILISGIQMCIYLNLSIMQYSVLNQFWLQIFRVNEYCRVYFVTKIAYVYIRARAHFGISVNFFSASDKMQAR